MEDALSKDASPRAPHKVLADCLRPILRKIDITYVTPCHPERMKSAVGLSMAFEIYLWPAT